ncbi:hypothetical protein SLW73_04445 [Glutamicibacter protophormiae]|uniref:hypothetical protein n=1 Tax=Glutamicibacter protophormiae TaxID=37930 RepID=UPI002A827C7F|nr:hypothetical protein [Glutamicibacter protophormiae]WPR65579.1 hypothetical protein SLW72_04445 [Glutamicibacter protophormiae]WPR69077.1 hypothetical protein SLW73_04445 [Glutamicibacter protophormiae]
MNEFDLYSDDTGGFDVRVDGRFLRDILSEAQGERFPFIPLLRRSLSRHALEVQLQRFSGDAPGEFYPHRVWLYFCPVCFDEGCGGVSVNIQTSGEHVIWSNFCFDSEPEEGETEQCLLEEDDALLAVRPLIFDRTKYLAAVTALGNDLSGRHRI